MKCSWHENLEIKGSKQSPKFIAIEACGRMRYARAEDSSKINADLFEDHGGRLRYAPTAKPIIEDHGGRMRAGGACAGGRMRAGGACARRWAYAIRPYGARTPTVTAVPRATRSPPRG